MGRISSVVFDVGNVLIRWDPRNLYRRMGYADAETEVILAETGLLEMNSRFDRGKPFAEGVAELIARQSHHAAFIEAFDRRWPEMLDGEIASNVAILRDLKALGLPVYAITNFARSKFDLALTMFPFLAAFDDIVVSADVGLMKPEPEIFKLLIDRQELDPSEVVFIDDSAANIAAATALGFRTIHVAHEHTPVRERLRDMGVAV